MFQKSSDGVANATVIDRNGPVIRPPAPRQSSRLPGDDRPAPPRPTPQSSKG